jgi:hypothetical protein
MTKILFCASLLMVFAQSSFAAPTCKEAVALKAAQTAQSTYGGNTTDTDCQADYNTIHLIDTDKYSISVRCGDDVNDRIFDVMTSETNSGCLAVSVTEDLMAQIQFN